MACSKKKKNNNKRVVNIRNIYQYTHVLRSSSTIGMRVVQVKKIRTVPYLK